MGAAKSALRLRFSVFLIIGSARSTIIPAAASLFVNDGYCLIFSTVPVFGLKTSISTGDILRVSSIAFVADFIREGRAKDHFLNFFSWEQTAWAVNLSLPEASLKAAFFSSPISRYLKYSCVLRWIEPFTCPPLAMRTILKRSRIRSREKRPRAPADPDLNPKASIPRPSREKHREATGNEKGDSGEIPVRIPVN